MKILHVEPDPDVRAALKQALEDRGHEVIDVEKISHGIEEISASRFDLVIVAGTFNINRRWDGIRWAEQLQREGRKVLILALDAEHAPKGVPAINKLAGPDEVIRKIEELVILRLPE